MKRFVRGALSALSFLLSLALTAAALHRALPPLKVPEFSDKFAEVTEQRETFDVLFLGSSRVRRQVSPRVFDEVTRQLGRPTRSFNFGLDGLGHPEILYVVDRLLERKPAHLRFVVIELTRFGREFGPISQPDSQRVIYWHTPQYTAMICRAIWEDPTAPAPDVRWSRIADHATIFLRHAFNVGRGTEWLPLFPVTAPRSRALGPERSGFFPVNERFPAARLAEYERQLAALPATLAGASAREPLFQSATLAMLEKLRRHGITPILVTMPRIHPTAPWLPEGYPALRFDDPRTEPALFETRFHYDPQHLNADGAVFFSRRLAERFVLEIRPP